MFYQELTLLENSDITWFVLWSKVYQQVHLALAENSKNDQTQLGISFPEYRDNIFLGGKIRVFATTEQELEQLNLAKWLSNLADYVHITSIRPVPKDVTTYASFKRYQPKNGTNKERMARRRAKREGISYEKALAYYKDWQPKKIREPFIRLKSLSNEHEYRLFIKKENAEALINEGFSSYGLSKKSSVPDF